ncbi:MAG: hypothetical protein ACM3MG_04085 [Bacillota bacterium]
MNKIVSFAAVFLFPFVLYAQERVSATLYDLKSHQGKKLFTFQLDVTSQGAESLVGSQFRDLNGAVVVAEKGVVNGAELVSYEIDRPQTSEKGRIAVRDGKIFFEYEGPGGKKKSADEKVKGLILCSANFSSFVKAHWNELSAGKELDVRFAVWDRLETVGFTLKKIKDVSQGDKKMLELQMKPTSFVIAALVDPVNLWYAYADQKIQILKGRVAPKIQVDGKWKDLDAEVVYTYDQKTVSK